MYIYAVYDCIPMSQSYVKECIFCKAKIRMSDQKEGKWLAYNQDGSQHDCKKKNGSKQENHSNNNGNNNDISLEVFLKKLESIGITIDINKLRNVNYG